MEPSAAAQQAQQERRGTCVVCGKECKLHCSLCKFTFYCSVDHQRADWKAHKLICAGQKKSAIATSVPTPKPAFNWETAPDPPANHPDTRSMQWMHREWEKMCGYVLTLQVREAFDECHAFWPTLDAPALLDESGFRKFCYYAWKEEHQGDRPKNYVPIYYVEQDKAEEWFAQEREIDERVRNFSKTMAGRRIAAMMGRDDEIDDDSSEGSEDADEESHRVDQKKEAKTEAKPVVLVRSHAPLSKDAANGPSSSAVDTVESTSPLLHLSDEARARIASFLSPAAWQQLTLISRSTVDWPNEQASFDYTVVCFTISNGFDRAVVGVARTLQDVKAAMTAIFADLNYSGDVALFFKFVDWDQPDNLALPLLKFEESRYYEAGAHFDLHEKAKLFLGVVDVDVPYDTSSMWGDDDTGTEVGCRLGCMLEWMSTHGPRRNLDLRHFAVRRVSCTYCGSWQGCICSTTIQGVEQIGGMEGNECNLWYVPDLRTTDHIAMMEVGNDPKWVIFHDEIVLWDTA